MNEEILLDYINSRSYLKGTGNIAVYLKNMVSDGRILMLYKNDEPHTFIAFSMCNDYKKFEDKKIWRHVQHEPNGTICFIEKMISLKWTKEVRKQVEEALTEKYPQIREAIWFRPAYKNNDDRKVIYRRKYYATNN